MEFILLINVKMPTSVGILAFNSRINTTFECYKQEKSFIFFSILFFYEQSKFKAQLRVYIDGLENNYNFTLIKFPYLDLWRIAKTLD